MKNSACKSTRPLQCATAHLDALFARCVGAYSDITLRGYRCDLETFAAWCCANGESFLPATPRGVSAFLDEQVLTFTYATIRRRVCAIKFLHRMSDVPSPVEHSEVYLSLRRAARQKGRRPKQVKGLIRTIKSPIIKACPDTLLGNRDAALIGVGYDTLCRSSELAWMMVDHIDLDGRTAYVPRSKSDPFGDGRLAWISPDTAVALRRWLDASGLRSGNLFRGLRLGRLSPGAMETSSIRRLIKQAARRAGLEEETVRGLSGHSMRVGAAQDLMLSGLDTLAIMTAGGWRNVEVVARYVEKAALTRDRAHWT
jgi:integrase/recombinase XerD